MLQTKSTAAMVALCETNSGAPQDKSTMGKTMGKSTKGKTMGRSTVPSISLSDVYDDQNNDTHSIGAVFENQDRVQVGVVTNPMVGHPRTNGYVESMGL
jgi:hypothetical protein